jgi:hypothetical protein
MTRTAQTDAFSQHAKADNEIARQTRRVLKGA